MRIGGSSGGSGGAGGGPAVLRCSSGVGRDDGGDGGKTTAAAAPAILAAVRRCSGVAPASVEVMTAAVGLGRRRSCLGRGEKSTALVRERRGLYCVLNEKYERIGVVFIV